MSKTILLVDDDDLFRTSMGKILQAVGYRVVQANDGPIGYELFVKESPDLILMDLLMPQMTGARLVQKIRGHEKGKKVPVIMLTGVMAGGALAGDAQKEWGVDIYLSKEVEIETVLKKVEDFIGPGRPR